MIPISAATPLFVPSPPAVEEASTFWASSASAISSSTAIPIQSLDDVHHLANDEEQDGLRLGEFIRELRRVATLPRGWDGGEELPPTLSAVRTAAMLGMKALADCRPRPHTLNLRAAADGSLSMLLFGQHGREVELLLSEDGLITAICRSDADFQESDLTVDDFGRVVRWLRGESSTL